MQNTEILSLHRNRRQTRGPKMSEKKMVRRNVAVALGIICVILIAALGVAMSEAFYSSSRVADLTNTLNLGKTEVWVMEKNYYQLPSNYTDWTFSINVSGYVLVSLVTLGNVYVRVIYNASVPVGIVDGTLFDYGTFYNYQYDSQITVSGRGTAVFPVLPSSNIEIRIGNTYTFGGSGETVSIIYYY
jgi:hypothetical protein